ncbi:MULTISPECIES: head-tail adaptor protein [Streptomyces]|uniref:Phage head-tail joining protein n=1 Tax=Streptomyces fradiae ATCC 10745 = DSM 40063 TaxID=1319510 RepID=A0A1Y2NU98_STRFR|nr:MULTISPECIES: hypothetical protein [Streptomyces]KAF0646710.1 hypothetical protein K701_27400 [Streptomyces fradiae ATCC 10745 = DSM 40063]OSY50597.1 hypothetical protein BG846_03765 [Streptomyces fradiae ATCC 10745 = DSM 40063]QEV11623.1 hypothetical protein CP974_05925 [Streptomyces fradiae ATCC 10745 = DSM 40063]
MMFNQTAVRVRAGTKVDRGGNTIPDWSSADRLTVSSLNIQPASQSETVGEERTVSTTGYRVQSAEGTAPDIRAADRIEWRGQLFDVDGEVAVWPELFTDAVHHIEFVMDRATG